MAITRPISDYPSNTYRLDHTLIRSYDQISAVSRSENPDENTGRNSSRQPFVPLFHVEHRHQRLSRIRRADIADVDRTTSAITANPSGKPGAGSEAKCKTRPPGLTTRAAATSKSSSALTARTVSTSALAAE